MRVSGSLRLPVAAALATVLSAICLGDVFVTGSWFLPSAFSVVLVAAAGEGARRLGAPRLLVPVISLVVLLCYLVARYARAEALLWVLPTPDALAQLRDLARAGNESIAHYAAPIALLPEVELFAVAGVGLVAVAVDTLAVTMRRVSLAGLPLLALYTVPASVSPSGVSWPAFALGGAGYLGLLLAEARERLSRWGRPLRFSSTRTEWQGEVETAPLAQVGRRVGAAALGLALVVPVLLPDIDAGALGFGGAGLGRGGGSGSRVAVINPIIDLGQDLRRDRNRPILRYEGQRTYLRLVGLDLFTGDTWKPSRLKVPKDQEVGRGLNSPPGLGNEVKQAKRRYRIEVFDLEQQWLPLPYPAEKVDIDGRWVYDTSTFNVFSTNASTRKQTYRVTSLNVEPTPDQLRAAPDAPPSLDRYLELPLGIPGVVDRTARQVTREADNHYDQALALQTWLRDPTQFTYSTEVADTTGDTNGSRAIVAFLDSRRGYCVHFASTMAVMARQLGIPARVAVGFTPGSRDDQGRWVVSLHDAHAWPELYFEGVGWVAFEPTPGSRTGSPPAWAQPEIAQGGAGAGGSAVPTPTASAGPRAVNPGRGDPDLLDREVPPTARPDQNVFDRLNLPVVPTLVVLVMLLLGLVPAATRVVVRRRRWRQATTPAATVAAAWAELQDTLLDHGYSWLPSDSPRRGVARAAEEMALTGESLAAVRRLGSATERARYAIELGEVGDLRRDVATVNAALRARTTSWGRARARWMPRSSKAVWTATGERVADALDTLDSAMGALRRRLVPQRRRA